MAIMELPQAVRDEWHVLGAASEITAPRETRLLGETLLAAPVAGGFSVQTKAGTALPAELRYGYLWTSLGTPARPLFPLPEFDEPDRRNLNAATITLNVSAPRAIENFLDMAHFPYVHTGILGEEPHTEVRDYDVEVSAERHEILATGCVFFQPQAAANAAGGFDVAYTYRVPHPYCAVLYKSNPRDPARRDVIAVFLQSLDEEHVAANLLLSLLDDTTPEADLRNFQQKIFAQDKPILENQIPKRLPLDPRAETPIRADKSAIAYRRWLAATGATYGTIPARG